MADVFCVNILKFEPNQTTFYWRDFITSSRFWYFFCSTPYRMKVIEWRFQRTNKGHAFYSYVEVSKLNRVCCSLFRNWALSLGDRALKGVLKNCSNLKQCHWKIVLHIIVEIGTISYVLYLVSTDRDISLHIAVLLMATLIDRCVRGADTGF